MNDRCDTPSGAELLTLLQRRVATHPHDPWAPLRTRQGKLPQFPTWSAPIFELLSDSEILGDDIVAGPREQLAGGWMYTLLAHRGEAYFAIVDGPENEGPFDLAEVLDRFCNTPEDDAREALGAGEICVSPESGSDFRFHGIRLYEPRNTTDEPWFEAVSDEPPFDDADLIASLEPKGKVFVRQPDDGEVPRPLFARSPVIDDAWAGEGRLTCQWRTKYFVPKESYTSTKVLWSYTRHTLAHECTLSGVSTADLAHDPWRYRRMGDLAEPLAELLSEQKTRRFFAPVYAALHVSGTQ